MVQLPHRLCLSVCLSGCEVGGGEAAVVSEEPGAAGEGESNLPYDENMDRKLLVSQCDVTSCPICCFSKHDPL